MRNLLRALAFSLAACLFVCPAYAAPYDSGLGTTIDTFLNGQASPLYGYGSVFFSNGVFYNVDPRLLVAIAGAETSYGSTNPCNFDAWGSLPNSCTSGYASYTAGIESVTTSMRQNYLNLGLSTIPDIATQYCSGQCPAAWITQVTNIYTSLGGDTTDLTFTGGVIDFEGHSGLPCCFEYYTSWTSPLAISAGGVTAYFYGGVPLSGTANLPGDQSTSYGTADPYCLPSICSQNIEIDFSSPVINFSTFLINGNTVSITYTVVDDAGSFTQVTLADNFSSGVGTIALPSTDRITQVIFYPGTAPVGACCAWDYFIDNVSFAPAP